MSVQLLSYILNIGMLFGLLFISGKKSYRDQTGRVLESLAHAQKEKIKFLEAQNSDQQKLIDELSGRVDYLEGLVLRGGTKLVEKGPVPDVRRGRRTHAASHPESGTERGVR